MKADQVVQLKGNTLFAKPFKFLVYVWVYVMDYYVMNTEMVESM